MGQDISAILSAFMDILRLYGLPLAILVAFGLLIIRGILRVGTLVDAETQLRFDASQRELADCKAANARDIASLRTEIAYRDLLRVEERDGRLAAEARLDRALETTESHTALLQEISRDVLRGQSRGRATT